MIIFRADASTAIGAGHVMRCLALAKAIKSAGRRVAFICRSASGDLGELIVKQGFEVRLLPRYGEGGAERKEDDFECDATETRTALRSLSDRPAWLVVDHYRIDRKWETTIRDSVERIAVIDDLANRPHDCDLLLDQNLSNPRHENYRSLVPPKARMLLGPKYALVRHEFVALRESALRRRNGKCERILVLMGATDVQNDTAKVLTGLAALERPLGIDVIIGAGNPWREQISSLSRSIAHCRLHVQTDRVAELMSQADVAITAGGSTTWERCVLGLPALAVIQSDDQRSVAEAVQGAGAQRNLGLSAELSSQAYRDAIVGLSASELVDMARESASLCDGLGVDRLANELIK